VGFAFSFINFDNPSVLGNASSLYAFVEPTINADRQLGSFLRFGFGPSYLNKVFDPETNSSNTFYSSPLSFTVVLAVGLQYRIDDRMNLKAMAGFNHISNGGIKNPNKGINYPTASIGIDYFLRSLPYKNYMKSDSIDLTPRERWFDAEFFATGKTDRKGHSRYLVYGFNASWHQVVGKINALSLGLEWASDGADAAEIERKGMLDGNQPLDHRYVSFLMGHDLILGRFNFSTEFGFYVYSPFPRKNEIYQRYGLSYYFYKNWFIGTNLKAHGHVADFLDFRTGLTF
jgi:hypothetical protein